MIVSKKPLLLLIPCLRDMYKAVLCLLLLGQVILGDNDTKQSVEEEEDLGLGEQWAITDENLEKTEKEISHFVVFICKYRLFF